MNSDSKNKVRPVKMMKRYCSKCEMVESNPNKRGSRATCTKCKALLHYQCVQCYSVLTALKNSYKHLKTNSCRIAKMDPDFENQLGPVKIDITISDAVDLLRPNTMMTRYCSKCEMAAENARKFSSNASCTKCGTHLHYQCLSCCIVFTLYTSIVRHLKDRCKILNRVFKTNNKRFKCNECTFETSNKYSFKRHVIRYHLPDQDKNNDNIPIQAEVVDQLPKFSTVMTRYCTKCEVVEPNVKISTKKPCMKCGTPLHYRCLKCSGLYAEYSGLHNHIKIACNPPEGIIKIQHKCNECTFETSNKYSFKRHLIRHHSSNKDGNKVNITTDAEAIDIPIYKTMTTLYFSNCEVLVPSVYVSTNESCTKC